MLKRCLVWVPRISESSSLPVALNHHPFEDKRVPPILFESPYTTPTNFNPMMLFFQARNGMFCAPLLNRLEFDDGTTPQRIKVPP